MTTKILTGNYAGGYVLSPSYTALTVKPSAYIGGKGLELFSTATVANAGKIQGENGGYYGAHGIQGVFMEYGTHLTNTGAIGGGAGYQGERAGASAAQAGGRGGEGILDRNYNGIGSVITNSGLIHGGAGGAGGAAPSGQGGAGGAGGDGVYINAYDTLAGTVTNKGTIIGGGGGVYGSSRYNYNQTGGAGGAGVAIGGPGKVSQTAGDLYGGYGGSGGSSSASSALTFGGTGGYGVSLSGGASLTVSGGRLIGGNGGLGDYGGFGGGGAYIYGGLVSVSGGRIQGGAGAYGDDRDASARGGFGGDGVVLNGHGDKLTQSGGTISGGAGGNSGGGGIYPNGRGGYGGDGVAAFQSATINQKSGVIQGGNGGYGSGVGGGGGVGIYLGYGGSIVCDGVIYGGVGGGGYGAGSYGGAGGAGIQMRFPGTVVNNGFIVGGAGGLGPDGPAKDGDGIVITYEGGVVVNGSATNHNAAIVGAAGVYQQTYSIQATTVTNFATIDGTGGVSVYFGQNGDAAADRLIVEKGAMFIGTAVGGGVIGPSGHQQGATLELAGGANTISGLGGTGTLSGAASATFSGFGSYLVDAGVGLTLTGANTLEYLQTLSGGGAVTLTASMAVNNDAVVDAGGGTLSFSGANGLTLFNFGTVEATGSGVLALSSMTVSGGVVTVASGATLLGKAGADAVDPGALGLVNNGLIEVAKGTLTINGDVTGTGKAEVAGGKLAFDGAFNENVVFAAGATGTLVLYEATSYAGAISGFSTTGTDTLDIRDIAFNGATVSFTPNHANPTKSGQLTVVNGAETAKIKLTGDYTAATFTLAADGHGGVDVTAMPSPGAFASTMAGFGASRGAPAGVHDPVRAGVPHLLLATPAP